MKYSWLYNIPDAHANSRGRTFSSRPPTRCKWSRFLLACHPRNLLWISNTNIPFTVVTSWISCFRLTRVRLSPPHRQMSKRSSSQYPTEGNIYVRGAFNKFPDFFVQAFKIVVDSWKLTMLLLYILWDDWPIFMISGSNKQLQQLLEYTLLKPDFHSW